MGGYNMKLKQYPKYKDSGVQWIGKIPEGWKVHRSKFLLSSLESGSRETGGGSQLDEGVFSLGGEHINWDGTLNLENTKLISEEYYNSMNQGKLKINDILLVKDGATIGKTAILTKKEFDKMAVNEHVFLMRSNKRINPKLLYYLICSDSGFKQIKLTEVGSAQGGINQDFIAKAYCSIPQDKQDQTTIANFLDKKTAKIDALIEKDKKLIVLLKEKRTALINHVVTIGLDPNVKLKDSGIDWIGEIPEGWEVHKLKYKTIINKKKLEDDINPNYVINYVDISNVDSSGNILDIEEQIFEDAPSRARRIPRYGDTILSTVRTYLKAIAYLENIPGNLIVSTGFAVLEPIKSINSKYLFYSTSSEVFIQNVIAYSKGVAYPAINPPELGQIPIIMPTLPEQTTIVNFLDNATAKIDKTIKLIEQKVNLLQEYKKSLIHQVVTGKMDVRGVEA